MGLPLFHYVSCRLGLELPPHVQLINRVLGTSPLHLSIPSSSSESEESTLDASLLNQVSDDLMAFDPSLSAQLAQRARHQGELDPLLHSSLVKRAESDGNGPAFKLLAVISNLRKLLSFASPPSSQNHNQTLLPPSVASSAKPSFSVIPAIAINTTDDDLKSLSDSKRSLLSNSVHKVEAMGRALDGLIPASNLSPDTLNFSLDQILNLPFETKLALAWRLRTEKAASLAAPSITSLLYISSLHRRSRHQEEAESFKALISAFSLEKMVSELDIVSPPKPEVPQGKGADAVLSSYFGRYGSNAPPLPPSDAELYRLFSSSSDKVSPLDVLIEGQKSQPASLDAFRALVQEGLEGKEEAGAVEDLPSTLKEWFSGAKLNMNKLTPRMLTLISRFTSFQIRVGKKEALESQEITRALLRQVVEEIHRSDQEASIRRDVSKGMSGSLSHASLISAPSLMNPLTGSILPIDPDIVNAILLSDDGSEEGHASFRSWLQSNLSDSASASFSSTGEGGLQPYDILAEQHLSMDLDRYLQMRHAPELSLSFESLPLSWDEASGEKGDEASFLGSCREGLESYLVARGMPRLTQVEWEAYSQQALAEFELTREEHESAMKEIAGASNMHNSRSEGDFLRAKLASGVKEDSPIYKQARGYLEVLLANPSWTFAQREAVVERLCELSRHFSDKKARASARGSPLAPLFGRSDEAAPIIPKLKRK